MNTKSTHPRLAHPAGDDASALATAAGEGLAQRAEATLDGASRAVDAGARSLQGRIDGLREAVPGAVSRVAARAEDLARRGIERARAAADSARDRALDVGDATVYRIREEPVKAVLIAAAVGAATTLLVQHWRRSRESRTLRDRR